MAIDLTQDPDSILVALINEENGRNIKPSDVVLSSISIAPDPVSGRETFNNTRTALTVSPAANSGYINQANIKYNRIRVRDMFRTDDTESTRYPYTIDGIAKNEHDNLLDLLPDINEFYRINLRPEDVFDAQLPVFEGPPPYANAYVRFEANAASKIFVGGVNLRILPDAWDLDNIQYTQLGGLHYPNGDPELPPPMVVVAGALNETLSMMATPGYWNYTSIAPSAPQ
jgi:hypothetical protein